MNQDILSNIRSKQICGELKSCYQDIEEYGIAKFPHDYLNYLESIGYNAEFSIEELKPVLFMIKCHSIPGLEFT